MPTYEYQCTANAHRFDVWQQVGESPPPCPECGAVTKKVFGVPRVIFKGSGFYVTDKRAESSKPETKSDAKSDAPAESKSDAKTETKTEAKAEAKADSSAKSDASKAS